MKRLPHEPTHRDVRGDRYRRWTAFVAGHLVRSVFSRGPTITRGTDPRTTHARVRTGVFWRAGWVRRRCRRSAADGSCLRGRRCRARRSSSRGTCTPPWEAPVVLESVVRSRVHSRPGPWTRARSRRHTTDTAVGYRSIRATLARVPIRATLARVPHVALYREPTDPCRAQLQAATNG